MGKTTFNVKNPGNFLLNFNQINNFQVSTKHAELEYAIKNGKR